MIKSRKQNFIDENFLKVPVWSNKINNLQIFQSFAFQAKYSLQKNAHFIIYIPFCRLGMSEWINGYKIQKRRKWKYFKK